MHVELTQIPKYDKHGVQLKKGDIIAEGSAGDVIWDGLATIIRPPLGMICVYQGAVSSTQNVFSVVPLRIGLVRINDEKSQDWMANQNEQTTTELYLTQQNGVFIGWDDIEVIGNLYDFSWRLDS